MQWSKARIREVRKGIKPGELRTKEHFDLMEYLNIPIEGATYQEVQFRIDRYLQARTRRQGISRKANRLKRIASRSGLPATPNVQKYYGLVGLASMTGISLDEARKMHDK